MASEPIGGALILAAGQGRRFGADKRSARLPNGTALLHATLARYREVFERLRVVIRPGEPALEGELREACPALECVIATRADEGMGHSLAAGVRACSDWDFLFVALGDMPFVRADTLRTLEATLRAGWRELRRERPDATAEPVVIRPIYADVPGHPVGFTHGHFQALETLTGDTGARRIITASPQYHTVPVPDPGIHQDVDVADDLSRPVPR